MAFFYKYEYTNKWKNIHPCLDQSVFMMMTTPMTMISKISIDCNFLKTSTGSNEAGLLRVLLGRD